MIEPRNLDALLHPQFDAKALAEAVPIGSAIGASPGSACGKIVFSAEDAMAWNAKGEKVILVRLETSPEDIEGMKASQGYTYRKRRKNFSCSCCCAWNGYMLCIRMRRYSNG